MADNECSYTLGLGVIRLSCEYCSESFHTSDVLDEHFNRCHRTELMEHAVDDAWELTWNR